MNISTHGHVYRVRTEEGLAALLLALSMLDAFREAA